MYRLYLELPGLTKMPNQLLGAHWRVRSSHARKWKHLVHLLTVGKRPKEPLKHAEIALTRFSSVEPDSDGLRGGFKVILDSLVHAGIIQNDKRENIGEPVCRWERAAPKQGKIQVVVIEATEKGNGE